MKNKKMPAIMTICLFTLSILPLNIIAAEKKVQRFCAMDTAVDRLLDAARIPQDLQKKSVVRSMAEDIITEKLAKRPGKFVKIEWKDVYDMRGSVNAWLVQNGHPFNRIGQALDAVGSGLTGTFIGKVIMMNGLMMAGPVGFIMLGGMNVTQETFQCNPSGVIMAVNAGATIIVLVPWCKVPGINKGCVALTGAVERGIQKAAASIFHKELSATFLKETANGVVMAIRFKSKDKVMTAMEILNWLDGRRISRDKSLAQGNEKSFDMPGRSAVFEMMQNGINWNS